jgi:hypothetical protein
MTSPEQVEPLFRRVVVILDASLENLVVLEILAWLPEALVQRLEVLFVEEEDLMRLAGFPFAREISFAGASARLLDVSAIERDLRMAAERARRTVKTAAQRRNLEWQFEVVRSRFARALAESASGGGLIALGGGRDALARNRLADLASTIDTPLLIVNQRGAAQPGPVIVHADDPGLAAAARHLGEQIARATGEPLIDMPDLRDVLVALGIRTTSPRPWARGTHAAGRRPGLVIIGRTAWPEGTNLDAILEQATCPVLIAGRSTAD